MKIHTDCTSVCMHAYMHAPSLHACMYMHNLDTHTQIHMMYFRQDGQVRQATPLDDSHRVLGRVACVRSAGRAIVERGAAGGGRRLHGRNGAEA